MVRAGPVIAAGLAAPGRVTDVDLDPTFVARAQANAPTNADYVVGDVYGLPFPPGSFDVVLSYTWVDVLGHPERAVAEMIRVCRARGAVSIGESVTGPVVQNQVLWPPLQARIGVLS